MKDTQFLFFRPDERYGEVGSYHVDILSKIFEVK